MLTWIFRESTPQSQKVNNKSTKSQDEPLKQLDSKYNLMYFDNYMNNKYI